MRKHFRLSEKTKIKPWLCLTLCDSWTVAHQAPLSMGFSRQEYWSGLPCPPPGDLPNPGTEPTSPVSPALQADSLPIETSGKPCILTISVLISKEVGLRGHTKDKSND